MLETTPGPRIDRSHIKPVTTREELIYLLSRASELEHGLACIYLFAAYSLKNDVSEGGLTEAQAAMVRGWRRHLAAVAIEEMFHLAQVSNLLTAIGGAPHFKRTNFPMPASAYPFGVCLTLEPFSQQTIERFVTYEMPEDGILAPEQHALVEAIRARVLAAQGGGPAPVVADDSVSFEPFDIDFTTVGEFYHKIETGFRTIPEAELFVGPPAAQANARFVDLNGELTAVTNRASACAAIEMIVEQGEAPTSAHPDAHFVVFDTIRQENAEALAQAEQSGIPFAPVRPVVPNPMTRFYDDTSGGTIIRDPLTHEVADLFNIAYDTMLLMLLRFFAHTEESEAELEHLSRATLRLMTTVLRPLGDVLAKMPVGGDGLAGRTAGPGFGYNRDVALLPHKRSAWVFFGERLAELASVCAQPTSSTSFPRTCASRQRHPSASDVRGAEVSSMVCRSRRRRDISREVPCAPVAPRVKFDPERSWQGIVPYGQGVRAQLVARRSTILKRRSALSARKKRRCQMNPDDFPAPKDGFVLTHFLVVSDQDRSRDFYKSLFDGQVLLERDPVIMKVANTWLILNVGGGPTDDKPTVTLTTPPDPNRTSAFLNVRVADIYKAYTEWSAKGAEFLTEPKDHGREIRAYIRDPDGHLIEVGQATGILS